MYQNFSDYINDAKSSGKDFIKSQIRISLITLCLLFVGFIIADIKLESMFDDRGLTFDILIPILAIIFSVVDALPVIGLSATMLPWAFLAAIFREKEIGLAIFLVYISVMVIKTFVEPFVRGKSLGVSPIEEVIASVLGYFIFGIFGNGALGFLIGPLVYTIGKKIYVNKNPDTFFSNFGYNYLGKNKGGNSNFKKDDVIDITDDVEDVNE